MSSEISTIKGKSPASMLAKKDDAVLSADQVESYLKHNPEFFVTRDELLIELSLPHESGKAISLLERQVTILRERGIDARHKLNGLLDSARINDDLFDFTRTLVLSLLEAKDLEEVISVAEETLCKLDNIAACEIILLGDTPDQSSSIRTESQDKLVATYPKLFQLQKTSCEPLDNDQIGFFFPNHSSSIRSTAICPIGKKSVNAILALGNDSVSYFNINLDTLFLDFIGEVIGAILLREIPDPDISSKD